MAVTFRFMPQDVQAVVHRHLPCTVRVSMTHVANARLSLLSVVCASSLLVGCSRINASNGGGDPVAPGATSADTVVAHTFFPEHRGVPENVTSMLHAPRGFSVDVFASGVSGARMLAVSDDGTVYVTRPDVGEVTMLRTDASGKAQPMPAASRVPGVHGIVIHDNEVYLATAKEVSVADINPDGSLGERRVIVASLPDGGQHSRRTIGIGPDGMLYISVGSDCNACAEPDGEHATMLRAPL